MSVVVVGSINVDITLRVAVLPEPGETVSATGVVEEAGGKGANQAAAAAALGADTVLVAAVGDDAHGDSARDGLARSGVRTHLARKPARTGTAYVSVGDDGENAIVVHPGANGVLTGDDVAASLESVAGTVPAGSVLVGSFEVPQEAIVSAARIARANAWTVIVNPAPARPIDPELLPLIDVLTPNATEVAALGGVEALLSAGVGTIVTTRGGAGCEIATRGGRRTVVPGSPAEVVSTVGAGDAFTGALAAALGSGRRLEEAARYANAAGALATESRTARVPGLSDSAVRARAEGRTAG